MVIIQYPSLPILIIDDEWEVLKVVDLSLRQEGINNIQTCQKSTCVTKTLLKQVFSVIVLDLTMPEISGLELLPTITNEYPKSVVIVLTAINDVETAVDCMKAGAFDYLVKPISKDTLLFHIKRAIKHSELLSERDALKESFLMTGLKHPTAFSSIITKNQKMLAIFKYLEALADTNLTILITGETGVGKELFAEAIHKASGRKGTFVPVNVAGLDDALFSDTLFGHKKGSFTGADTNRKGLIEQAEGGTLFLDEIGDLSTISQIKLLRLLQDGKYHAVGSDSPQVSQARVVTATNHSLELIMKQGTFRKDLYYRLESHHICIPPLRERYDDLELLVYHFFQESTSLLQKKIPTAPNQLFTLLQAYSFPGNVRELRGMIFDAVSRHEGGILSLESFYNKIQCKKVDSESEIKTGDPNIHPSSQIHFSEILPTFKGMEKMLITEALHRSKGNKTLASKLLGIKRQALQNRIKKLSHAHLS